MIVPPLQPARKSTKNNYKLHIAFTSKASDCRPSDMKLRFHNISSTFRFILPNSTFMRRTSAALSVGKFNAIDHLNDYHVSLIFFPSSIRVLWFRDVIVSLSWIRRNGIAFQKHNLCIPAFIKKDHAEERFFIQQHGWNIISSRQIFLQPGSESKDFAQKFVIYWLLNEDKCAETRLWFLGVDNRWGWVHVERGTETFELSCRMFDSICR